MPKDTITPNTTTLLNGVMPRSAVLIPLGYFSFSLLLSPSLPSPLLSSSFFSSLVSCNDGLLQNYKEPEPKEIPSLLTIASHVVASELLSLSPSFSSPSNSQTFSNISLLPTKLLDMVCGKIAKSDQGSVVFDFLEKSTGRKVSLSSRIDAAHSLEQKTRNFTNVCCNSFFHS